MERNFTMETAAFFIYYTINNVFMKQDKVPHLKRKGKDVS